MVRKTHDAALQDEKETVVFLRLTKGRLEEVQRLCNLIFGDGYHQITIPDQVNSFGWVAMLHGLVVGFGIGHISVGNYQGMDLSAQKIGILHMVGVAPEFRDQGIGAELMIRVTSDLRPRRVFGFAWARNGVVGAHSRLQLAGLQPVEDLGPYWQEGCDAGNFDCPDREDGCTCRAVLYATTDES